MHYVMSDIHGNYDAFLKMLSKIKLKRNDRLYILGDVIDRGEDGIEILKYIMSCENIVLLKGNHERDMCAAICQKAAGINDNVLNHFRLWFYNGGEVTYRRLLEEKPENAHRIVDYVNDLSWYEVLEVKGTRFILVHAGLLWNSDFSIEENLEANKELELLCEIREGFLDSDLEIPYTVIAGHTPVRYLPEHIPDLSESDRMRCEDNLILFIKNKILIDCGCGIGCKLGCLRLEDMKEFYV